jgi:hypothetical protein
MEYVGIMHDEALRRKCSYLDAAKTTNHYSLVLSSLFLNAESRTLYKLLAMKDPFLYGQIQVALPTCKN